MSIKCYMYVYVYACDLCGFGTKTRSSGEVTFHMKYEHVPSVFIMLPGNILFSCDSDHLL